MAFFIEGGKMLPTITIFGREIAMYGLCVLVGAVVGIAIAVSRSKMTNVPKEDILYASMLGMIGVGVGGKILYLITIIDDLWKYREQLFSNADLLWYVLQGGFVFYGGLIGAFVAIFIYCNKYNINRGDMVLAILPSAPLIHAFGRIGCFCAGCCFGIPYDGPLSITFEKSIVAPLGISLFPIQLVESGINLIIYIILEIVARKTKNVRTVAAIYMIGYGIMRFGLEYVRGDAFRGFVLGLSTSQWISIFMILMAIIMLTRFGKTKEKQ